MVLATLVIVAFHRPRQLARLLEATGAAPGLARLVVNVEDDVDVQAVAVASGAEVVALSGNPGFAAAVNTGVRHVSSPFVVIANDDVVVAASAVLHLVAAVQSGDSDVALPQLITSNGEVELTIMALPTLGRLLLEWALLPDEPPLGWAFGIEKWRRPVTPEGIESGSAAIFATRRSLLVETPLPERYFLYWEEQEWFWQLRTEGIVVEYRPEISAVHDGGRTEVRPQKSALLARNAVRCVRHTQGRGRAALAVPIVVLWNLRLWVVDVVRATLGSVPARQRLGARRVGLAASFSSWREVLGDHSTR